MGVGLSLNIRCHLLSSLLLLVLLGSSVVFADEEKDLRKFAKDQVIFGIQVAQLGLWKEAAYRWEKAVKLDPSNSSARNNLAVAYEQSGEFEMANDEYERALDSNPNNIHIRQNYELFREAYERKKRTDRRSGQN